MMRVSVSCAVCHESIPDEAMYCAFCGHRKGCSPSKEGCDCRACKAEEEMQGARSLMERIRSYYREEAS